MGGVNPEFTDEILGYSWQCLPLSPMQSDEGTVSCRFWDPSSSGGTYIMLYSIIYT